MEQKKKEPDRWPHVIPEPIGDPPMEPVIFGDNGTEPAAPVIITDPLGSYTGVPLEPGETPVQDADDL
ncbi:MAG: hypothetical protein IIW40_01035 [Clostridia bacterium]|nr:hypothetical protein [Clostridia bacterium]